MESLTPDQLDFIKKHADALHAEINVVIKDLREQYITQLEGFHAHTLRLESHYSQQINQLTTKLDKMETGVFDRHNEMIAANKITDRVRNVAILMSGGNSLYQATYTLSTIEEEIEGTNT